ncbi:hypothetical protein MJT46_015555 [Ovis ammon polii x Ovis aries]|nr:hypothetical protein MJT46_015555 [Ovis ammon polii x Ovis aries]
MMRLHPSYILHVAVWKTPEEAGILFTHQENGDRTPQDISVVTHPQLQYHKHTNNGIPYDYTVEVRNRFKGLDLIDRVPDELWTEVHDIVQETGIKTIPMEKKRKKAKWLSGEALQTAVKRREAKSKGEKERYKHLNAEFQRIAKRDKKAFLSGQCKEVEENNRMGKTRDLFKKIRDTKGTFQAKMGSIKDRNGLDLTEAEDIKKRWQEYTEELYKKIFTTKTITMV